MWLQCWVIRGLVGVVCGRFGPGLRRRPQIDRKRLRPDLGQPPIAATLEALDESAAKNVTDVEVAAFVRDVGAGCQELHSIDLSGCIQVSDEGLRALSTNCPKMEHIDLSGCEISDNGLRALIAGCLNLQHVNLAECKISDEGLRTLSTGCPKMEHIDLFACQQISDNGLRALIAGCPNLQHVNLVAKSCIASTCLVAHRLATKVLGY